MPRKSGPFDKLMVLSKVEGHTRSAALTLMHHGARCPDLSGPARAFLTGYETKKDIPMLKVSFLSCITVMRSVMVMC